MFTHYSDPHGCEWLGGELNAFVDHYNQASGTAYSLTQCLDVVQIGGQSPKEPEVLLTDSSTGQQMVIERKSVVTPKSYIYQHQLEHEFADLIWRETGGLFQDAGYSLTVGIREVRNLTGAQMRSVAQAIGDRVAKLSPGDLPVNQEKPIRWSFRRLFSGEEEVERRGIVVTHVRSMSFDDNDRDDALAELPTQLQAQLDAAAAKFNQYAQQTKVVLLDFYSEELWEDDVPPALEGIHVPGVIDEIWRTIRDWISPDDYRVGYERLVTRSH
jgi:hypothetical protein